MEIRFFSKLSTDLSQKLHEFELDNFYSDEQRKPEYLAEEADRFFSLPRAWLVVFEKEQIIGRVSLHRRKVKFEKQDVILGGLGKVCTRRDKRRQGIAIAMLEEALRILKEWGCDLVYLCANVKESGLLYARAGFIPLNKPYTYYGRSGKFYEESNGMIAALNSPRVFEAVLKSKEKLHLGRGNW